MEQTRLIRIALSAVAIILMAYFLVLPMFWTSLPISVQAGIASEWRIDEDMPIPMSLSYWQGNTSIRQVRLTLFPENAPQGPENYPALVYDRPAAEPLSKLQFNRLTFPRRTRLEVMVPFTEMVKDIKLKPGNYTGKLEITVQHAPNLIGRRHWTFPMQESILAIPFQIVLK